jgi:hypothetical protein
MAVPVHQPGRAGIPDVVVETLRFAVDGVLDDDDVVDGNVGRDGVEGDHVGRVVFRNNGRNGHTAARLLGERGRVMEMHPLRLLQHHGPVGGRLRERERDQGRRTGVVRGRGHRQGPGTVTEQVKVLERGE